MILNFEEDFIKEKLDGSLQECYIRIFKHLCARDIMKHANGITNYTFN
jgi:hypothetical protein